jgi:hypothetical protein
VNTDKKYFKNTLDISIYVCYYNYRKEKEVNEKNVRNYSTANFKEVKKMSKYEYLVSEYARVRCNIEYLLVLKRFETKIYKVNREYIDEQLEELRIQSENLLTELENAVNNKEPV